MRFRSHTRRMFVAVLAFAAMGTAPAYGAGEHIGSLSASQPMSWTQPIASMAGRSVGVVEPEQNPWKGEADRTVEHLVGSYLVFLEKPPIEQASGYPAFRLATPDNAVPTYGAFVGKLIRVDRVDPCMDRSGEFTVTATNLESGMPMQARTTAGAIPDVAPVQELERAKERWLGGTIYPRKRTLQTYDAASGRYGELAVRVNEPLKVVDVVWGLNSTKPIWVIVERSTGEQGFIATAYSWTNVYQDRWAAERPWEDKIVETAAARDLSRLETGAIRQKEMAALKAGPDASFYY